MKMNTKWILSLVALAIVLIAGVINGVRNDFVEPYSIWIGAVLVILGLVIGVMNIKKAEYVTFMVASLVLLGIGVTGIVTIIPIEWEYSETAGFIIQSIFGYLIALMSPIAMITAGKAIFQTAKD